MDNTETKSRPYPRFAAERVRDALADARIVAVLGPRQSGKTTLVKELGDESRPFLTLDDAQTREFARSDPEGFVRRVGRAAIDEIQRAPELLLSLKKSVDEDPRPGRFLITGSVDLFAASISPDSLAGRVEVVKLLPLSQAELLLRPRPRFLERAFANAFAPFSDAAPGRPITEIVTAGGFPEALAREAGSRHEWFASYAQSLARRDIPDLAALDKIGVMPSLINKCAHHAGQLINLSGVGAQAGLDAKTVERWMVLLEQVYLVERVPPWFNNRLKRASKTPKLHFYDSGLLAALRGVNAEQLSRDRADLGPLLETFVFSEISKLIALETGFFFISHYRDKSLAEVDFVLERYEDIVGIEVKAGATVRADDFKGLKRVREAVGVRFKTGLVLYDGDQVKPFGDNLYAAPYSILWE
ncbi:MAG: ATP-binding protein [Parvularculaceae bacterium]